MKATDAIKIALTSTQETLNWYISDLSDADLLVRPVPRANHIAWQLGHLISAEPYLIAGEVPNAHFPELPPGFNEKYSNQNATSESTEGFATKAVYLELFGKMRAASIAALDNLADADLDNPTKGPMAKYAPTLGALFQMTANHTLMHAGQFSVVRRKLGKPILF